MPEATSDTDLIRFFQRYARTSMAHESDALAAMYGPNFLVGGPRGSKVFANDPSFVAWLNDVLAFNDGHGMRTLKVISAQGISLGPIHTLAAVRWGVRFEA